MTLSDHVTLKEVAKITRTPYHTVRRRVLSRQLSVVRIGRIILINRVDIVRVGKR